MTRWAYAAYFLLRGLCLHVRRMRPAALALTFASLGAGLALAAASLSAQPAPHEATTRAWSLSSGGVTYRLAERGGRLVLDYFGPGDSAAQWDSVAGRYPSEEFAGFEDGGPVAGPVMRVVRDERRARAPGVRELQLTTRHATLPLEVEARYTAYGETGVFTRRLVLRNAGAQPLPIASASPLLAWSLPTGEWTM